MTKRHEAETGMLTGTLVQAVCPDCTWASTQTADLGSVARQVEAHKSAWLTELSRQDKRAARR